MGKLTKTQKSYLYAAAVSPIGRTVVAGGTPTLAALVEQGLVTHHGFGIVQITPAGRSKLQEQDRV